MRIHRYFFYLLILFLPTQLGFHFWPGWAYVLGRRIDYLSPTLYLTDVLIILMLLFWFIEVTSRILNHELRIMNNGRTKIYYSLLIVLSLFIFGNIYFSLSPPVALYHWVKLVEFGLLGFYIVKTKPQLSRVSYFLSLAMLYSSVIAIWQFVAQHSLGGLFWWLGERTFTGSTPGIALFSWCHSIGAPGCQLLLRSYGTFPHPNVLAGFLVVVFPVVIASETKQSIVRLPRLLRSLAMTEKYVRYLAVVSGIIALVLTFSRSAWVVGGIGILYCVYRILYKKDKKQKYTIHNTRYAMLPFIAVLIISIGWRFFPSTADESVVVRMALNRSAIQIWQHHPWFGVGLGNFLVTLPSALPSGFIYFLQPVHNIYFLLLSEIGIIGVIGVIGMIWSFRKKMSCSLPLLSILTLGLVDHYALTLQQGQLLLTLFIGLLFV